MKRSRWLPLDLLQGSPGEHGKKGDQGSPGPLVRANKPICDLEDFKLTNKDGVCWENGLCSPAEFLIEKEVMAVSFMGLVHPFVEGVIWYHVLCSRGHQVL